MGSLLLDCLVRSRSVSGMTVYQLRLFAGGIVLKLVVTACTTACVLVCCGVISVRAVQLSRRPELGPHLVMTKVGSGPFHVSGWMTLACRLR